MDREPAGIRAAFLCYELLWGAMMPLLSLNHRLSEGFRERRGAVPPRPSDVWIQAASVGEAYLAREILMRLGPFPSPMEVLLTTNTRQGWDIHRQTAALPAVSSRNIRPRVAYFPFDRPSVMKTMVRRVKPTVAVLLETEIWPGFFRELRSTGARVFIVNGRISRRSLDRYLLWPSLWRRAAPHQVLAVSEVDAARFRRLFGSIRVTVMPNIKFDRIDHGLETGGECRQVDLPAPIRPPFVILGSVRREEESLTVGIIARVRERSGHAVIGLFPRHLHRIGAWQRRLNRMGVPWVLRSRFRGWREGTVPGGTVVLWDVVGELATAYRHAEAAFVGGSLAPLGGQNFIEAVIAGVVPVIGPSWEDFRWVGEAFFESGLARIADDWRGVADQLIHDLNHPPPRSRVRSTARAYFSRRKGGAAQVCGLISTCLAARPQGRLSR